MLCDVALDEVGAPQRYFTGLGLDLVAIEFCEGAIFLNGPDGARVAGDGIQLGRLVNREGILVVRRTFATGRVRLQLVVAHGLMITRLASSSRRLSPKA